MIAALVPMKSLEGSKSRLAPYLGSDAARGLSLAMLEDVLEALLGVPEVERVAVTTPDDAVGQAAANAGAEALVRADPGLNPSIEAAAAELLPNTEDGLLVVLGDVAGACADDLARFLRAAPRRGIALAPSLDGGTSALLRRPRDVIPAAFGTESAKRHVAYAEAAGVEARELPLPSLRHDLDAPEDLDAFLATPWGGARTRAFLREFGKGR
ncbi:MAG: 2-phospho-L-lactate guanylyltransferase [Myxococcota bacterium]|nr:2-phospho-L-lactate guanylyltransferase [Myxococcota bacterium]